MKELKNFAGRWLTPSVFGAWALALLYLIATRRYTDFLRPEFVYLLGLALLIAIGFTMAAVARTHKDKTGFSDVPRALVLLLPLLYLVAMPDTMLGHNTFQTRFIGTSGMMEDRRVRSMKPYRIADEVPGYRKSGADDGRASAHELTILELFRDPATYRGRKVMFIGMILRDESLKPHFGGRDTAVFRFMIICCAADALPLAIGIDSDHSKTYAENQWVLVEGVFDLCREDAPPVPFLGEVEIRPIEAPKAPYLF